MSKPANRPVIVYEKRIGNSCVQVIKDYDSWLKSKPWAVKVFHSTYSRTGKVFDCYASKKKAIAVAEVHASFIASNR